MRLIQQNKDKADILEVAWMWLPTFIGQNTALLGELDHVLNAKFSPPIEVDDVKLDEIHRFVIDWLCSKLQVPGLWHYLRAIEDVGEEVSPVQRNLFRELRQVVSSLDLRHITGITVQGTVSDKVDLEEGPFTIVPLEKENG